MEENQTNTMNLGNNIGGAMPPVFSSVDTTSRLNTTDELQVTIGEPEMINTQTAVTNVNNNVTIGDISVNSVQTEAQVQSAVPPVPPEDNSESKEPIVLNDDITVPTILLRDMVAQARKVGISNNLQPLSEILNLIIDENGITMKATSGKGRPDFMCTDKKYVSTTKIAVSLDIRVFGEYLNAEKNNTVTLKFIESEGVLYITTDTGVRKFPQRMDESTHQPIVHKLQFPYNYDDMMNVDYTKLRALLDLSSSARDLANTLNSYPYLQGLYCGDDIVVASDGNVMTIQPNQTEFKNEIFFLNNDMCKLITDIHFEQSKFKVGITKVNGFVAGITISDGRTTICGPITVDANFPVSAAKEFWGSTGFTQSIRFETRALLDVIKSIVPFIPSIGDAVDKITFEIKGDEAEIKCLDGSAKEVLGIINNTNYNTATPIPLPASKLGKVLQSVKTDNFDMLINPTADNCVCLSYDGIRNIVTTLVD